MVIRNEITNPVRDDASGNLFFPAIHLFPVAFFVEFNLAPFTKKHLVGLIEKVGVNFCVGNSGYLRSRSL